MADYRIFTDSACDISSELLNEWGVSYKSLTFKFEGEDKEYLNDEISAPDFYAQMKGGKVAKTAAVNTESFKALFTPALEEGYDVLYLGFSSGLSTTYNSARLAGLELSQQFPDRKIITVDTLAASAGQGLLVYLAVQKKAEGATVEQVAEYIKDTVPHLCHWFTVDDLVYLKRGGRVSAVSAFVGGMLGIKPVLHVDDEGHLVPVSKVRGRKTSIAAMADRYTELAIDPKDGVVFISHAECEGDAKALADILKERHGAEVMITTYVGPVIGAHSGPGTLALFFLGKNK